MLHNRRKYRRPCTKNIQKLGSRFNNLLVNGACFHLFAINSSTSDFLAMKLMRQTVVPLFIKKLMRWKCRNCRDILDLGLCTVANMFFCWVLLLLFIHIWISSSFQFTPHFCYSLYACKIPVLSSWTLGCFHILVLESPVTTQTCYYEHLFHTVRRCHKSISPFSTGAHPNSWMVLPWILYIEHTLKSFNNASSALPLSKGHKQLTFLMSDQPLKLYWRV